MRFLRQTSLTLFLVITSTHAYASDTKVSDLETRIDALELRVKQLESLFSSQEITTREPTSRNRWKDISNWRKLSTQQSYDDVRKLLGEPAKIDGGVVAIWYYGKNEFDYGQVSFIRGVVHSWIEPKLE